MLLAVLVRLPFQPGLDADILVRWIRAIQSNGLATIYAGTGVNYPPVSLYLLTVAGWLESHFPQVLRADDRALIGLIKLPAVAADVLTALLIARAARGQTPFRRTLVFAAYAFNPAIWYVAAYWTQLDALYTLALVWSLVLLLRHEVVAAWLAWTIAIAVKLQSIAFAPLLLVASLRRSFIPAVSRGVLVSLIAAAVILAPFVAAEQIENLVRACTTLAPRVDESAFNFWYLVRLGDVHMVSSSLHPLGLPTSYKEIGIALFGTWAALICALVWRNRGTSLALAAALLSLAVYLFLTEAHERFLFPALGFLLLAAADRAGSSRRLWYAYALLSLTFLFNLISVASFAPELWTNIIAVQPPYSGLIATLKTLALGAAATNLAVFGLLMVELGSGAIVRGATGRQH